MYSDFYSYGPGVAIIGRDEDERQDAVFHFVQEEGYGEPCGILLYGQDGEGTPRRIPFTEEDRQGSVYTKTVKDLDTAGCSYQFSVGDRVIPDKRGLCFVGKTYGEPTGESELQAVFPLQFDWKKDTRPKVPFEEMVMYCMHVRGFTAHTSSGVKAPGTFAGAAEKICYLKNIGVTTVEFQPIYEFLEKSKDPQRAELSALSAVSDEPKLNYWGYRKGYYFAPKAAYARSERADTECKEMIRSFHQAGLEVVLQFYFWEDVTPGEILSVLQFWACEYHVDGFHLIGDGLPVELLTKDPLLSDRKLFYHRFEEKEIDGLTLAGRRHLLICNDDYLYDFRKFLKGDAGMLSAVMSQFTYVPENLGRVHYLTNYNGFTLNDLVTYNQKHNEANGEDNLDGNDFNFSWNCGEEGPVKNRKLQKLRHKQIRNAYALLLLTASVPMIFMGDEFGNSQMGNNNPYCQDNEITWLDWSLLKKNKGLMDSWKQLVLFRKNHPVLRPAQPLSMTDSIACGYPGLSIHGTNAWKAECSFSARHFGMMLCEAYVQRDGTESNETQNKLTFLYLAFNMSGEERALGLPKLPGKGKWQVAFSTDETVPAGEVIEENSRMFPARSVTILTAGDEGGKDW